MRAAWHVITVMALANLIGIVGLVWWLHFSGRLDGERVQAIRAMLGETIARQAARERGESEQARAEAERQAELVLMSGPPVTASEALSLRLEASEIDLERVERLKREVRNLTETLARERRLLDADRLALENERAAFDAMRERLARIEGDEQFAKSVGVLENLRPAEARRALLELIDRDREQVVSYLNAMKARQRTKILDEFIKGGQADLAAELLEAIRLRGLESPDA
jgi:hypothetical protein